MEGYLNSNWDTIVDFILKYKSYCKDNNLFFITSSNISRLNFDSFLPDNIFIDYKNKEILLKLELKNSTWTYDLYTEKHENLTIEEWYSNCPLSKVTFLNIPPIKYCFNSTFELKDNVILFK